jgi:hypothetical protein
VRTDGRYRVLRKTGSFLPKLVELVPLILHHKAFCKGLNTCLSGRESLRALVLLPPGHQWCSVRQGSGMVLVMGGRRGWLAVSTVP